MKTALENTLSSLSYSLLKAKEKQVLLTSLYGEELTKEEREKIVIIWNGLDSANLAIHEILQGRKIKA